MNPKVLKLWSKAWQPPDRRPPSKWIAENVSVGDMPFDFELYPWLREPADFINNFRVWMQIFIAVTQCGKSRLMEATAAYWLSEDPGDITAFTDSNDKAAKWGEERFIPLVKTTVPLEKYLPEDRHKIRKDQILFTHAVLDVVGANQTETQSISRRYILGDEVWHWDAGMLDNAIRRTSAITFAGRRKIVLGSTAWDSDSDLESLVEIAEQRVWHSDCPHCNNPHAYVLSREKQKRLPDNHPVFTLEWDTNEKTQPNGIWDFKEVVKTAHLKCSTCGNIIEPTPSNSASLKKSGRYIIIRNEGSERIMWLINGLAVGGGEGSYYNWGMMVTRFLQAQQMAKLGVLENLKEVLTKDFCEPWAEEIDYARKINPAGGYSLVPAANGILWLPPEDKLTDSIRLVTVDHQATDPAFYFVVRDWVVSTGESRLVEAGTANTWDEIYALTSRHKLVGQQRVVFVDAGHDPAEVWLHCSENQWFALRGSDRDSYAHSVTVQDGTKRTVYKPYSSAVKRQPGYASGGKGKMGIYAFERMWGNLPIKDILSRLVAGKGALWGLPSNLPSGFLEHLNSESKKKIGKEFRYCQIAKRPNHYWDCECMQIVGAMVWGALQSRTQETKEPTEQV